MPKARSSISDLSNTDRRKLLRWSRGRSTPARLVLRANIVLDAAQGLRNEDIAEKRQIDRTVVGRWRRRFAQAGLAGIEKDLPRSGRRPVAREAVTAKIIEWTTQKQPANAAHWSCRTLGKELGVSRCMINR